MGSEIVITRLVGKWKASQNQPAQNQTGVVRDLRASEASDAVEMADLIGVNQTRYPEKPMSDQSPPVFNQLNIVSGDPEASLKSYRQLGVEIFDNAIWRTRTGTHHITAQRLSGSIDADLDIDSVAFAGKWNDAWKGQEDLAGRVVIGFQVSSRERVDALYDEMTAASYRGLQRPFDAFWGSRYAIIEDPDGIAVGVMSPVSAERKSPPPAV